MLRLLRFIPPALAIIGVLRKNRKDAKKKAARTAAKHRD